MSLTIKDPEVERLARELAEAAGEDIDAAVARAVKARLEALRAGTGETAEPKTPPSREGLAERLMEIARRSAAKCVHDDRTPDEILGYDENGLPS